jgi:hypothetical protein
MNDWLDDHSMGVDLMTDGSHDHHMNDPLDDLTMDVSRDRHMNDPLDDLTMDVSRVNRRSGVHLNAQMVHDHRVDLTIDPECYVRRDLMTDVNLDVSLYLHMNDPLDDHSMDASRGLRMSDLLGDQNSDVMTDENRGNRNCVRRDQNLVVMTDVSRGLRMNGTDDRNDLKTDGKKDAMNRRVMCY